jgi:hypothetical protein
MRKRTKLFLAIGAVILNGMMALFVLMKLWEWFVIPFQYPEMNYPTIIGMVAAYGILGMKNNPKHSPYEIIDYRFGTVLMSLLIGYIAQGFL